MPSAKVEDVVKSVSTTALLERSLVDWRPILAKECQVYVLGEQYLGKCFDQINFKFCGVDEAKQIVTDNLYALLRYKYFTKSSDATEKRVQEIIKSFTVNLKTSLIKVSLDEDSDSEKISFLEDGQVAFKNGVFDFRKNDWLFKYDIIKIPTLKNNIYMYDTRWIVQWYFNFDFDPLPININEVPLGEFIEFMREADKAQKNYCFELMWNISHDITHKYDFKRFKHFCEIFGYTLLQTFSQNFILLIGSGQNGKNSVFDGCFTHKLVPTPASNSLDDIENDRFITGALENKSHNIFLETSAKTYTESKMIKALTGSMYQTVQNKGIDKFSSVINCKYVFAGNDQEKIKFSDTTNGFRRRINIFEIFYRWDSGKRFLLKGDYYDTSFSDNLRELKEDLSNTIIYIYFGMYGILFATKNFTSNFKFTENDWKMNYTDVDFDLKEKIELLTPEIIARYIKSTTKTYEDGHTMFFDMNKERLYSSKTLKELGYYNFEDMLRLFEEEEAYLAYFSENDVYMSVRMLQMICGDTNSSIAFSQALKKLYSLPSLVNIYNNKPYVKVSFSNKRLKVLG